MGGHDNNPLDSGRYTFATGGAASNFERLVVD